MGNAARARMIKQCDRQLLDCFSECARNVLKGNVPLKKRQYASLQRRKKDLRTLASKDVAQEEKSHSATRRLSDVVAGACSCRVGQYTG